MEFSELLIKEHEPIRRAITVLEGMTNDAGNGRRINRNDVNALLIFLHYFADACHQAKEETILFPILRQSEASIRVEGVIREQLQDLLKEHSQERSLVEETQLALFSERPSEFVESARKLAKILSEHALKEEQVLFPLAKKILTRKEADEVLMRIEEADTKFGSSRRTLLVELLQELEQKYSRTPSHIPTRKA
jgi:regulator of cell morphogenesis and NO signaling